MCGAKLDLRGVRNVLWIIVVSCLVFTTLGSSHETLSIPVAFQHGLRGYLGIQGPTVGGALHQENRGDGIVWVNDRFEVRVTEHAGNGQTFAKVHLEVTSTN